MTPVRSATQDLTTGNEVRRYYGGHSPAWRTVVKTEPQKPYNPGIGKYLVVTFTDGSTETAASHTCWEARS